MDGANFNKIPDPNSLQYLNAMAETLQGLEAAISGVKKVDPSQAEQPAIDPNVISQADLAKDEIAKKAHRKGSRLRSFGRAQMQLTPEQLSQMHLDTENAKTSLREAKIEGKSGPGLETS